ncbi:hypothetical protein GOB15_11835 [Sinorhizobium meliloti]|nr:hypothetical protein [Sinorhizobium meliloti]MDW9510041.1 hypothetical protein [Sinorhizobium meliloti]
MWRCLLARQIRCLDPNGAFLECPGGSSSVQARVDCSGECRRLPTSLIPRYRKLQMQAEAEAAKAQLTAENERRKLFSK